MTAMGLDVSDSRVRAWERRTDISMIVLALLFTGGYAWPIIWPETSQTTLDKIGYGSLVIWGIFAVDLSIRLAITTSRVRFLRRNWLDVLALGVPAIRALRVLRILALAGLIARRSKSSLRVQAGMYTFGVAVLLVFAGGLAITDAERGQGGNIETVGDGWWWALTTITTVGYGDRFPVTTTGRAVATVLMLAGIGLLGVVTASLASWFVERMDTVEQDIEDAVVEPLEEVLAEVRELRREVQALRDLG